MKRLLACLISLISASSFASTMKDRMIAAQHNCKNAKDEKTREIECGIYDNFKIASEVQSKVLGTQNNNQLKH